MLNNKFTCKYETPYTRPFGIMQCFTNGAVALQIYETKIRYDIRYIYPYKYEAGVDNFHP